MCSKLFFLSIVLAAIFPALADEGADLVAHFREIEASGQRSDFGEFANFLQDLSKTRDSEKIRTFLNYLPKFSRKKSTKSVDENSIEGSADFPTILRSPFGEETSTPKKFSYAIRDFYRYYCKQYGRDSSKNKDEGNDRSQEKSTQDPVTSRFNNDDYGDKTNDAGGESSDGSIPTIWRNIVTGPSIGCPPGYMKDSMNKCRKYFGK